MSSSDGHFILCIISTYAIWRGRNLTQAYMVLLKLAVKNTNGSEWQQLIKLG